jgi:Spy/CpxP family protein refolding chaperone
LQSAPRTWQSERTILELRDYRRTVHAIAMEQGADEAAFEALLIEMMKRGIEPAAGQVNAMLAQLKACDAAASA